MKIKSVNRLLLIALCFCFLTGCTRNTPAQTTNENYGFGFVPEDSAQEISIEETVSTGTFAMPYNASYGWDPYNCRSMENQAVMDLIYEGLFTMNSSFDPEPVLCSEYTISDDGLQYTLTLREAHFSDGRVLSPEDVLYSFQQAQDSDLYSARFRDVSYMSIEGEHTVYIFMNNPNDRLPVMLDFPIIPNLSSTVAPVGTGPFTRENGQLVKNNLWWNGAHNVSFDVVNLYSSASAEDTRDHFEIDTLHFVYNDPLDPTAATYHCDYELWNSKSTIMQFLGFNMSEGVFQDNDLRSAVLKAIDRAEITEKVYRNFADAAVLPVSPSSSMYFEDLALEHSYDRDAALQELLDSSSFYLPSYHPVVTGEIFDEDYVPPSERTEEASAEASLLEEELDPESEDIPDEETDTDSENPEEEAPEDTTAYNRITLLVMGGSLYRSEAAELVAEQLTQVGFSVTVWEVEYDEFIYTLNNQKEEWDLYYCDVFLTPDFDLRSILYSGNKLSYGGVPEDSTLRSLYYDALENSGNRYDLYEYIMERAYLCPVLFQNNSVYTTRGVFSGLNPAPGNLFYGITNVTINN